MPPKYLPEDVKILDDIQRHRMQTLLAVDEMVESIVLRLTENNVIDNTYFIYTSDNGFHIGFYKKIYWLFYNLFAGLLLRTVYSGLGQETAI